MVKVPRISDTRVKKTAPSRPRLSTDAPLEAFGGGASAAARSDAARGLASDVSNIILRERKKADDAQFNEKSAEFGQLEISLGEERNKNKGKDALGYPERENEARDQGQQKILNSITNRRVKRRLQSEAISFSLSGQKATQNYVSAEIDKYDRNSLKASVDNNRIVALNSGDDKDIQNSIIVNDNKIREYGKTHGLSDDEIELSAFNATSVTHAENIERLLGINTDEAKVYYNVHKLEINQKALSISDLERKIKILNDVRTKEIQDKFEGKLEEGTLTPEEVLEKSGPVSEGGIGNTIANRYLKRIKSTQDAQLTEIASIKTVQLKQDKEYINLVDKLIDDRVDNFTMKQALVDAYIDGSLTTAEKKKLSKIRTILKDVDLNKNTSPWNPFTTWFRNSTKRIDGLLDRSKFKDADVTSALRKIIDYDIGVDKDEKEMESATNQVIKEEQIKKDPNISKYTIGEKYSRGGRMYEAVQGKDGTTQFKEL